ncbi:MAG TPA: carboxypeptidase regulatory-like domain-containing protein [Gemmatimonadaceae bacterium]|nr:carboxypeptidase regulatory-like domain-containing protein [Gemmatimonadaceae bacterium]
MPLRTLFLRLAAIALLAAVDSGELGAQQPVQETAMLSGVVKDTLGKPIPDAEVVIIGVGLSARTSTDGVYALFGIPPGIRRVLIRRVGFEQLVTDISIEAGADARMDVDLFPSLPQLAEVVVTEDRPAVGAIAEFEHRRKTYNGTFITESDIARRKPLRSTDLVRGVSGVSVKASTRGPGFTIWMGSGGVTCRPALYLDGIPTTEATLDNFPAQDMVGIEVYRKAYDAPPPYLSTSGCGVVAFWSRTGPKRDGSDE